VRRPLLERFKTLLVYLAVSILVLMAVVAVALRLLVAFAPEFRHETEAYLSDWVGRDVTIGGLRAEWHGLNPRLVFEHVTVAGSGQRQFRFGELEVALSLRRLVMDREVAPAEVAVSGLELTVERLPNDRMAFAEAGTPEFLAAVPARVRVRNATVRIIDHVRGDVYSLTGAHLLFEHGAGGQQLSVSAELPAFLGQRAQFVLKWSKLEDPMAGARLYAKLTGVQFAALRELGAGIRSVPAVRGNGDLELWASAGGGRLTSLAGKLSLEQLGTQDRSGVGWFDIGQRLNAQFDWRETDGGWALDVDHLGYQFEEDAWPTGSVSVRYRRQSAAEPEQWRIGVDYIELARLRRLVANLPLVPDRLRQWAQGVELGGELREAGVEVERRDGAVVGYAGRGTLSDGRYSEGSGGMGVSGLDVSFSANERGGEARVIGRDGELSLPHLFRGPIPYGSLETEADWARDGKGWRLVLSGLRAGNADGTVEANVRLSDLGSGNPFLDVSASTKGFSAAHTSRYLPAGIMKPDLVSWLDNAVNGGRVTKADLVLYGRADDFPYEDHSGVFEVRGHAAGVRFDYVHGWPQVNGLAADLHFSGNGMRIAAERGSIFGLQVRKAVAEIPDFRHSALSIDSTVRGPGNDYLRFLRQAPITEALRPQLKDLGLGGTHRLDLKLNLPLSHIGDSRVDGTLALADGTLSTGTDALKVSHLDGAVHFDQRGIDIDALKGEWRGRPVTIGARTVGRGRDAHILAHAALTAGPEALGLGGQDYVQGAARWELLARFPAFGDGAAREAVPITVQSSLEGMRINLPDPLGKPPEAARDVTANFDVTGRGVSPLVVHYGERVTARVDLSPSGTDLRRVAVHFGSGQPVLPEGRGVRVSGHLDRLDLASLPSSGDRDAARSPGAGLGDGLSLAWLDLTVGQLDVAGQSLRDVSVVGSRRITAWVLRLSGPDIAGDIRIPRAPSAGAISARLAHLRLRSQEPAPAAQRDGESSGSPLGDGAVPSVNLTIDQLSLDGRSLGRFSAVLDAQPHATRVERFSLDNPVIKISGSADWDRNPGSERTRVDAEFDTVDVGKALDLFGYAKTVHGGESHGTMQIGWAGGPAAMELAGLNGSLDFNVRNGRIPTVEPGAGRVFGLLSLATIPRRLSLDFSDLFREGFTFDEIEAKFDLKDGVARPEEFYIVGPAARLDFSGTIDLGKRRFDQVLTVTPQVSSALPLIGGLTGGPMAAVALFLTQQLFQDQMDQLARSRYRVTGPWSDPVIEPIKKPVPKTDLLDSLPSGG